jgi:hypothetical protein
MFVHCLSGIADGTKRRSFGTDDRDAGYLLLRMDRLGTSGKACAKNRVSFACPMLKWLSAKSRSRARYAGEQAGTGTVRLPSTADNTASRPAKKNSPFDAASDLLWAPQSPPVQIVRSEPAARSHAERKR